MFETKLDDFYSSEFLNYCLHLYYYIHNVLANMSSGLLQVFVKLGSLHRTSNHVLYLIHDQHRLKHCEYNNEDEYICPKTLNNKNIPISFDVINTIVRLYFVHVYIRVKDLLYIYVCVYICIYM